MKRKNNLYELISKAGAFRYGVLYGDPLDNGRVLKLKFSLYFPN